MRFRRSTVPFTTRQHLNFHSAESRTVYRDLFRLICGGYPYLTTNESQLRYLSRFKSSPRFMLLPRTTVLMTSSPSTLLDTVRYADPCARPSSAHDPIVKT